MVDWTIAGYFGVGVFLTQAFHTVYSAQIYGQKQVRMLEHISGFSRSDPSGPRARWLLWFPGFTREHLRDEHATYALWEGPRNDGNEPANPGFTWPWNLPNLQWGQTDPPWWTRLLGLQATNLVYCIVAAAIYGVLAAIVARYAIPPLDNVSIPRLLVYAVAFTAIHFGSWWAVGSSAVITMLESNLAFNTAILTLLAAQQVGLGNAIGLLQFSAALTVGPTVFWLHFHEDRGHVDYGKFISLYLVLVPIIYAEFMVLLLGIHYA
jgi:hypothetical protein